MSAWLRGQDRLRLRHSSVLGASTCARPHSAEPGTYAQTSLELVPGSSHNSQPKQKPVLRRALVLVELTRHNLNSKLVRYLREHPIDQLPSPTASSYRRRLWRIRDRLSERDVVRLILAFKLGAPKQALAERYGIGLRSVKKILRQCGVKKRSRYDIL